MLTDRPACAGGGLSVYTKFCTPSLLPLGNETHLHTKDNSDFVERFHRRIGCPRDDFLEHAHAHATVSSEFDLGKSTDFLHQSHRLPHGKPVVHDALKKRATQLCIALWVPVFDASIHGEPP